MTEPKRISAEEAHKKVISGEAILVCAYDDGEKFRNIHLQNAISLRELKTRIPALSRGQEVISY